MKTGSKALLTGTGLIAAFAVFFAVNIIVNQGLRDTRIDLTQARLYTLSDGTRNVLKAIPEPITLRLRLPSLARKYRLPKVSRPTASPFHQVKSLVPIRLMLCNPVSIPLGPIPPWPTAIGNPLEIRPDYGIAALAGQALPAAVKSSNVR